MSDDDCRKLRSRFSTRSGHDRLSHPRLNHLGLRECVRVTGGKGSAEPHGPIAVTFFIN
jgi:hypothetical protein